VKDDLAAGRLVQVLPAYAAPSRPIHILFSAKRPQTPRLRSFIDAIVEAFGRP
jgi:DNA-binding transcriptional LysR family regulator